MLELLPRQAGYKYIAKIASCLTSSVTLLVLVLRCGTIFHYSLYLAD